jgi:hypothetical protein
MPFAHRGAAMPQLLSNGSAEESEERTDSQLIDQPFHFERGGMKRPQSSSWHAMEWQTNAEYRAESRTDKKSFGINRGRPHLGSRNEGRKRQEKAEWKTHHYVRTRLLQWSSGRR